MNKMAKKKEKTNPGVVELKVGASLTGPTKRMVADLHSVALDLNKAKNAMVRHWQRWHEDHPEWKPEPIVDKKGNPKFSKKNQPLTKDPFTSDIQKEMYKHGREVVPHIYSGLVAGVCREVIASLKGRTPYNHPGLATFRWEAILWNEVAAPSFRELEIPVKKSISAICYEGDNTNQLNKKSFGKELTKRIEKVGQSSCVLYFPLFSDASGRKEKHGLCRLEIRQRKKGQRRTVRRVCQGELKLSDSKIVFKEGRKKAWSFQLTFEQEVENLGLNKDNIAVLVPCPGDSDNPFKLEFPNGKSWYLGKGKALEGEYSRLQTRRRMLQMRYKTAGSGSKGHGRKRFYGKLAPHSRAAKDLTERIIKMTVADIIRGCIQNDCGRIMYREPTKPLRTSKVWFAQRATWPFKIPFNWTGLEAQLANKAAISGIEYEVERMRMKEFVERNKKSA
jgi:hypothetical protein